MSLIAAINTVNKISREIATGDVTEDQETTMTETAETVHAVKEDPEQECLDLIDDTQDLFKRGIQVSEPLYNCKAYSSGCIKISGTESENY